MPDADQKMVLRTVSLPPELDDELRVRAFRGRTSKSELIRQAIVEAFGLSGGAAVSAGGMSRQKAANRKASKQTQAVNAGQPRTQRAVSKAAKPATTSSKTKVAKPVAASPKIGAAPGSPRHIKLSGAGTT